MRFVILHDDIVIEDIAFLRGRYKVVSTALDEEIIYEVDDELRQKIEVFEEAGLVKTIKAERIEDVKSAEDIMRLSEKVQLLKSGSAFLRVYLAGHEIEFTERELLSPLAIMTKMIRLRKNVKIKRSEWDKILDYWLARAEEIDEITEEDEIREKILSYLHKCIIYNDINKAVGRGTLFFDEKDSSVVYGLSEHLSTIDGESYSLRRIAWIMHDYLCGKSMKKSVLGERRRFWRFNIKKCEIDVKKQQYNEELDRSVLMDMMKEQDINEEN